MFTFFLVARVSDAVNRVNDAVKLAHDLATCGPLRRRLIKVYSAITTLSEKSEKREKPEKANRRKMNQVLQTLTAQLRLPETEDTWKKRQDLCSQLSDTLERRKTGSEYPRDFFDNVKNILSPLCVAASAERTTLSTQACRLLGNLAKVLGIHIHPFLDIVLPSLIGHCGSTKAVNQKNANDVIVIICTWTGYNSRLVYHVCTAFKDKRTPPRIYAPTWLNIILSQYSSHLERTKDYPTIEKALLSGLNDGQVKVREATRATFWQYKLLPNNTADKILEGLNSHAANALLDDSHNPDKSSKPARPTRTESSVSQLRAEAKQRMKKTPSEELPAAIVPQMVASNEVKPDTNPAAKPFLSAPVRRARIVATPIVSASQPVTAKPKPNIEQPASRPAQTVAPPQSNATFNQYVQVTGVRPSSRNGDPIESATRSMGKAVEALHNGTMGALGYKKLKKLLETFPFVLITTQEQYNYLLEGLVSAMVSWEEFESPQSPRNMTLTHPVYTRGANIMIVMILLSQYRQFQEPRPGMVLSALLMARATNNNGNYSALENIHGCCNNIAISHPDPTSLIDSFIDTIKELEFTLINSEPDTVPDRNFTPPFGDFLPSALEPDAERQGLPPKLALVMGLGLQTLSTILFRLAATRQTLYGVQEDRLVGLLQHCMATYTRMIGIQVMQFTRALHGLVTPERRFYDYFGNVNERNLAYYYVTGGSSEPNEFE